MPSHTRIRIDPSSGVPAVRQIADNLRVLLVGGQLAPGAALPPVRRVAVELGVHFNTVAEAYRQLAAEGWLDLKHGRGAVVLQRANPAAANRRRADDFLGRLRTRFAQMLSKGIGASNIATELRALAEEITR